ncbi:MAG TPA: hypothetical protein VEO54_14650 [Thermoanaerobaculia bacterium]|nr:hypothetical protein [Thermoanaerobaculia bacterium]
MALAGTLLVALLLLAALSPVSIAQDGDPRFARADAPDGEALERFLMRWMCEFTDSDIAFVISDVAALITSWKCLLIMRGSSDAN